MSDDEDAQRDARLRAQVLAEFVDSEAQYLRDLQTMQTLFVAPLLASKEVMLECQNLGRVRALAHARVTIGRCATLKAQL